MMAAMEKDYAQLQVSLQAAHQETESLQRERETARRQANDLQERLQNTELQVVSLKLEIEAKQAELDGLYGKVSRLEQAMSAKNDDDSSKATTARVTPTRGFESGGEGQGDESCSPTAQQLAAARHELAAIKQELHACQMKLKEKSQLDLARLSVRCHKSILRREEEHERQADLESQLVCAKEESQAELCQLQKQLVEKTNMLLESEKKFAQLLAWVQKNKAKST
jgi:chromosome segregation ATPase